jgi:hypothetical protein
VRKNHEDFDLEQWLVTWLLVFPVALLLVTPALAYIACRDAGVTRLIAACVGAASVLVAVLGAYHSLWLAGGLQLMGSLVALLIIWISNRGREDDETEESDSSVSYHAVS